MKILIMITKVLIHYEDLIKDPTITQNKLVKLFDLKIKSDFNDFYNNVTQIHQDIKFFGGIRLIDLKNAGKYMRPEHFNRIKSQLLEFPKISEYLIKYGYEKDCEWEKRFLSEDTK